MPVTISSTVIGTCWCSTGWTASISPTCSPRRAARDCPRNWRPPAVLRRDLLRHRVAPRSSHELHPPFQRMNLRGTRGGSPTGNRTRLRPVSTGAVASNAARWGFSGRSCAGRHDWPVLAHYRIGSVDLAFQHKHLRSPTLLTKHRRRIVGSSPRAPHKEHTNEERPPGAPMNRKSIKRILVTLGVTAGFLTAHRRPSQRRPMQPQRTDPRPELSPP